MTECERLSKHILELQKDKGELTDKVRELENRIEGYKNQIFYKEKALDKVKRDRDRIVHRVTKDKKRLIRRNTEFKAQIEKMKLCQNCKYEINDYTEKPCRDCSRCLGDIKREGDTDNWELSDD